MQGLMRNKEEFKTSFGFDRHGQFHPAAFMPWLYLSLFVLAIIMSDKPALK